MSDEQHDWFFTFGMNHLHPETGQSLGNSYIRVHGTFESARTAIVNVFWTAWCWQYASADEAGVERFGLTEVPLPIATGGTQ